MCRGCGGVFLVGSARLGHREAHVLGHRLAAAVVSAILDPAAQRRNAADGRIEGHGGALGNRIHRDRMHAGEPSECRLDDVLLGGPLQTSGLQDDGLATRSVGHVMVIVVVHEVSSAADTADDDRERRQPVTWSSSCPAPSSSSADVPICIRACYGSDLRANVGGSDRSRAYIAPFELCAAFSVARRSPSVVAADDAARPKGDHCREKSPMSGAPALHRRGSRRRPHE